MSTSKKIDPPEASNSKLSEPPKWHERLAAIYYPVAVIFLVLTEILPWFRALGAEHPVAAIVVQGAVFLSIIALLVRRFHEQVNKLLAGLTPWVTILTLLFCASTWLQLRPSKSATIGFQAAALFNSWDDSPGLQRCISVCGAPGMLAWETNEDKTEGHFTYATEAKTSQPDNAASSGGYLTFYQTPCDRLSYKVFRFACKATGFTGTPDIGVRLCVDVPAGTEGAPWAGYAGNRRERVAYEIKSLSKYTKQSSTLADTWKSFDIDLEDFQQTKFQPPLPEGLDANTINKVVFFVTPESSKPCPQATLWFKEIEFK